MRNADDILKRLYQRMREQDIIVSRTAYGAVEKEAARLCRDAIYEAREVIAAQRTLMTEAADILRGYAGFIRSDVKAADIERHPYLPAVEAIVEALDPFPIKNEDWK